MFTPPKDNQTNIDPLDTLTQEQKKELRNKVIKNINSWIQYGSKGRPGSSWKDYETYDNNRRNPLFERMAWELINENFYGNANVSSKNPSAIDHIYAYLNDFFNYGYGGFDIFRNTDPWLKKARKDLTEYLINVFPQLGSMNEDDVEAFNCLAHRALADPKLYNVGMPDRQSNYHIWEKNIGSFNADRYNELQQLRKTL